MDAPKRVLVVKGKAGLGNRLLSVLGSILYCKETDRLLCVDWTDGAYAAKGTDAFGLAFHCNFPSVPLEYVSQATDVYPTLWRNHLHRSVTEMIDANDAKYWDNETAVFSRYSIRWRPPLPANQVVVRWSYHDDINEFFPMLGLTVFNETGRFLILRDTVQKHLAMRDTFSESCESMPSRFLSGETIGVHVRYTDNRNPLQVQLARLNRLATQHPKATIFLATDSAMVEKQVTTAYPGRVMTTPKPLLKDGKPLHRQGQAEQARRSAMLDLQILTRCDHLIYSSRSTFGYCAALMSQCPRERQTDCLTVWQRLKRTLQSIQANCNHRIAARNFARQGGEKTSR